LKFAITEIDLIQNTNFEIPNDQESIRWQKIRVNSGRLDFNFSPSRRKRKASVAA